jgi:cytochrome c-type biogenesis protein CcmH/NrfF
MREIVFDQVESGKTDEEIKNYFVERYGPVVLMQPPNKGVGRIAWIIPPIGFLIAIIVVYMVLSIMRRKRSQIQDERLYYDLDVSLTSDERKKYIALIENEEFSRKGKIR